MQSSAGSPRGTARGMRRSGGSRSTFTFWILSALLVLAFLTGGSFRANAPFLFLLRPFAILALAYGLAALPRSRWRALRVPLAMAGLVTGLTAIHLIPLPPMLWQVLPGHEPVRALDALVGAGPVWRPLSLVPSTTLNALFALSVPLASLVLAAGLDRHDHVRLFRLLLALAAISAMVGLLQATGLRFNLYVPTGGDRGIEATGLFANKNHQAVLLAAMLPMLAIFARIARDARPARKIIDIMTAGAALVVVILLIVTGSRAGLVLGGVSLLVTLFYGLARIDYLARIDPRRAFALKLVIGLAAAAVAAVATTLTSRGLAFTRMANATADLRPRLWESILPIVPQYMPWGSGIGSYVDVYRAHEPVALLRDTYSNHAHNEYLEVALTAGIPGILLIVVAGVLFARAAWKNRHGTDIPALLARLGTTILLLLAAASVTDYPLRTPLMGAVFAIAVVWCAYIVPQYSEAER